MRAPVSRFSSRLGFLVLFVAGACASGPRPVMNESNSIETTSAPLEVAPLALPPITESKLENGLSVVTVEKHDLPLVTLRLVLTTGAIRDPVGKAGLASFTGSLLRRGTATRSGEELDDTIESSGGLMGIDVGFETTSIVVTVPREHLEAALGVISELVRAPSFPMSDVDIERRQLLAGLAHDLDDPSYIADRAISGFFYGTGHPYGRAVHGHTASVSTFVRDDVVAFHEQTYSPSGAMLFFAGDIEPERAREAAEKLLGGWEGPVLERINPSAPVVPPGVRILLVDKPDASQAQVRATAPGLARRDARYHAAVLANTVVGGGFTSRLVDEVRVNRGLSYSVGTRLVALRDFGAISFSTFTRTDTVREILDVSLGVLDAFAETGPTDSELGNAKRYVIGLYPGRVESIEQLTEALASMRLLDLPFDEIERYRGELASVEDAEVRKVASLWPGSRGASVVVVGDASKILPQLEGLGEVSVVKASAYR